MTERTDEELLLRHQRGQKDAFALLVRRYEGELFGYLRRYLGDRALAEDVFQNTFLQLYVKSHQYEAGRPVRPWLYTIATHQAIDALRRLGRHPTLSLDRDIDAGNDETPQLFQLLEAQQPGPLDQVEASERRQLVREAVDRLPDFLKQVVILTYYQGLKQSEVAEILGIPVGTVKSRMNTALTRLYESWTTAELNV